MKKEWIIGVASLIASAAWAADSSAPALTTEEDKVSYSIGTDLGKHLQRQGITINSSVFTRGIEDGIKGGPLLLSEDEMKSVLNDFQKKMMAKRAEEVNKQAQDNKAKGDAFLASNKAKAGVVTLPSGLQYKIITAGKGAKPTKDDTVTVDYTGKLINGTVFDSSEKTGKPATFKVTQVIPGWTEALQLMPVGSTWELYIPANLAYGERSVGGAIGPNETLIFNVHLISVEPKKS
jgi:FKBP-type peptidyl-prolyl cis-trans isomerase FklB